MSLLSVALAPRIPRSARAESYAILYAGGNNLDSNNYYYYRETMRMYYALLYDWNFHQQNITIIHSDGPDAADDRQTWDGETGNTGGPGNSDWTIPTGYGTPVLAATRQKTYDTITNLQTQPEDLFYLWTFDHGGGAKGEPQTTGEETLVGWNVDANGNPVNNNINDEQLAAWCSTIKAERQVYSFGQCFAGGMLDDLNVQPGETRFGCAGVTHYETHLTQMLHNEQRTRGFIQGWDYAAEQLGYTMTHDLYQYAYENHPYATDGEGPGGTYDSDVNHPWKVGANLDMFRVQFGGSGQGGEESRWSNPDNWGGGDQYHMPNPVTTTLVTFAHSAREAIIEDGPNFGGYLVADWSSNLTTSGVKLRSGGTLQCAYEVFGQDEFGKMTHYGSGVNVVDKDLVLGRQAGALGLYVMDAYDGGELTVWGDLIVGDEGTGRFYHDSGQIVAVDITLGRSGGDGTFTQDGSDVFTTELTVGGSGSGTFTHTGGAVTGSGADWPDVYIGRQGGGDSTYTLSGTGRLGAQNVYVGYAGTGHFTQDGGMVSIVGDLILGNNANSVGTYTFNGGTLLPGQSIRVGRNGQGTFTQTAGTIVPGGGVTLGGLPGSGTYTIQGGVLDVRDGVISVGPNGTGMFNLDGGTVIANKMAIGSNGTIAGTSTAAVLRVNRLTGLAGQVGLTGSLEIGHADGSGTREVALGMGVGLSVQELVVAYEADATMTQAETSSVAVVHNLVVGRQPGTTGTYEMTGNFASFSAYNAHVGHSGAGHFTQTRGSNTLAGTLYLGTQGIGYGTYTLNESGTLEAEKIYVGYDGRGEFNQNSGIVTVNQALTVGYHTAGNTYSLSSGELYAPEESIGDAGRGTFTQDSGLNDVGTLHVGRLAGSTGVYDLNGGQLEADYEVIGEHGTGTLTQTSGSTNTVAEALYIGSYAGGHGTVNLKGGTLDAGEVHIGGGAGGELSWTAGSLQTDSVAVEYTGTLSGTVTGWAFGGTMQINSGTVSLPQCALTLDNSADLPAELNMSGVAVTTLTTDTLTVGEIGHAVVTQTGGTATFNSLDLGKQAGSQGTYELSNGNVSAGAMRVGVAGTGTFTQNSGNCTVAGSLCVGAEVSDNTSYYNASSGELRAETISVGVNAPGVFTANGATVHARSMYVNDDGTLSLMDGTLRISTLEKSADATVTAESENATLLVNHLWGFGDTVGFAGTFGVGVSEGIGWGLYNVGNGQSLSTGKSLIVGENAAGTLTQTGGTVTNQGLSLGHTASGEGTYDLSGTGQLTSGAVFVGNDGAGTFTQTGGTHTVGNEDLGGWLVVGSAATGRGTYDLQGGDLVAVLEAIGGAGNGLMKQTGGTNTATTGIILGATGGRGTYAMSDGVATAGALTVGSAGFGVLACDGGQFDVLGDVTVASDNGSGMVMLGSATLGVGGDLTLHRSLMGGGGTPALAYAIQGTTAGTGYGQIVASGQGGGSQEAGDVVPAGAIVTGSASVAGTLIANFGGYTPVTGDTFDFVTGFSEVTGSFQSVSIVGLTPAFEYTLTYDGGTVRLTADSDGVAAEPGTTTTEIDASGIGGSSGYIGGLTAAFQTTSGGLLTSRWRKKPKSDLGGELPALPGAMRVAGESEAQWWDVAYDGPFTGYVTLTFAYDPALLGSDDFESSLLMLHHNGTDWEELELLSRNPLAHTLTVRTTSFSPFLLGGGGSPPPVPEPASLSLLGLALLARKRRRR